MRASIAYPTTQLHGRGNIRQLPLRPLERQWWLLQSPSDPAQNAMIAFRMLLAVKRRMSTPGPGLISHRPLAC